MLLDVTLLLMTVVVPAAGVVLPTAEAVSDVVVDARRRRDAVAARKPG